MDKRNVFIFFLVFLIAVQTSSANNIYYMSFEFSGSILENGFLDIENNGKNSIEARTDTNAAYYGIRGLWLNFRSNGGSVYIHSNSINYNFDGSTDLFFSFFVYNKLNAAELNVLFEDAQGNWMGLKYGTNIEGWDNILYFFKTPFPTGDWSYFSRNIADDYKYALSKSGGAYSDFTATRLIFFEFMMAGPIAYRSQACFDDFSMDTEERIDTGDSAVSSCDIEPATSSSSKPTTSTRSISSTTESEGESDITGPPNPIEELPYPSLSIMILALLAIIKKSKFSSSKNNLSNK
ncbi:MAG: hypothetical protein INQ03_22540 [Candidatus Heimdallarchaeota archaeon]|nr:hypothetical protein [Candidatus Heimdallarchaeota archaeon]